MALPSPKTLQQFQTDLVTGWVGNINQSLGITTASIVSGDPLLAIMQSVASQCAFLQGQVSGLLAYSRAATAQGADLDSWFADFGYTRSQGTYAAGTVTFKSGSAATTAIVIPAGTVVQSPPTGTGLTLTYTTNSNVTLGVGQTSVNATVTASQVGSSYNAQAGQITQLASPISGITSVTNLVAFTTGSNAASDAAARAAFVSYIQNRSDGTLASLQAAVQNAATTYSLGQNFYLIDAANVSSSTIASGAFPYLNGINNVTCLYLDSNQLSGGISTTSLGAAIVNAMTNNIAAGMTASAYASPVSFILSYSITINCSSALLTLNGFTTAQVQSAIQTALTNYVGSEASIQSGVGVGKPVLYSQIISTIQTVTLTSVTTNVAIPVVNEVVLSGLVITDSLGGGHTANSNPDIYPQVAWGTVLSGALGGSHAPGFSILVNLI